MSARLRRTGRSFAAVFVAFWVYRLLVAPWIDPSFVLEDQPAGGAERIAGIQRAEEQRLKKYARIFPPGSWELDQPIMLESEGVELLMKDYENLAGGRIKLSQCTMLYFSDSDAANADGRVVVLRAPQGAILEFDADLNLRRGKVGKLVRGQLQGPVTIHGTPSRPGADDELFIATRDVHIEERRVWSRSAVEFRYGPSQGKGRELVIHLLPGGGNGSGNGPNIGGLERVELLHDVEMQMQPGSTGLFPGDGDRSPTIVLLPEAVSMVNEEPPVEIRCRGPFRFDLVKRVASFEDQVKVYRALPQGVYDQMMCETLWIFFGDKTRASAPPQAVAARPAAGSDAKLSLQVERVEAKGNPVNVIAPSNELEVRANRLEYEILRRRVTIEAAPDQPEASLAWKLNRFGGRSVTVERPDPKALPLATSVGAGWFDVVVDPSDPASLLHASWSTRLDMRPVDASHVVSLVGDARANSLQSGDLRANQIDLWLVQLDQSSAQSRERIGQNSNTIVFTDRFEANRDQQRSSVTPLRMLAVGSVRFASAQLSGEAQRLDVRFDPAGTLRPTPPKAGALGARSLGGDLVGLNRSAPQEATAHPLASPAIQATPSVAEPPPNAEQHFELHGQQIEVQLASQGDLTQVNHVMIQGGVHLLETKTEQPTDPPIEIRGDWLNVQNAADPRQTTTVIKGKPAFFAARGMEMSGGQINLDRRRNLVWIDGSGRMVLPPSPMRASDDAFATATGHTQLSAFDSLSGGPVSIDFAGGMQFDGKVARYEKQVIVSSEERTVPPAQPNVLQISRRTLETEVVKVTLRRAVDFATQRAAEDAEAQQIACLGNVLMTQRSSDNGALIAVETLTTRDLTIDQVTGELDAFGPGWLESMRLGSADPFAVRTAATPPSSAAQQASNGPVYVRVDYQGKITGNAKQGKLVLHDDIRGVYGPIERWGDKLDLNARVIGAKEIRFRSDELAVRQVPGVQPKTRTVEMEAIGNTDVYGQAFTAQAHRLTYVQGKDQLVFEGDGRSAAELYHQPQPGGPWTRARAGKLEYWRSTGQAKIHEAQFLDLGQVGGPPPMAKHTVAN